MDEYKIPEATQEELGHLLSSAAEIEILMQETKKYEKENWPKWAEQKKLQKQAEYDKLRNGYELPISSLVPILELRICRLLEEKGKDWDEVNAAFVSGCVCELGTLLGYLRGSKAFEETQPDFTLGEWAGLDESLTGSGN